MKKASVTKAERCLMVGSFPFDVAAASAAGFDYVDRADLFSDLVMRDGYGIRKASDGGSSMAVDNFGDSDARRKDREGQRYAGGRPFGDR